jgi:hypothetical protein
MAASLTTREWNLMKRKVRKSQVRKYNAPTRGVKTSQQEQNAPVIAKLEALLKAQG